MRLASSLRFGSRQSVCPAKPLPAFSAARNVVTVPSGATRLIVWLKRSATQSTPSAPTDRLSRSQPLLMFRSPRQAALRGFAIRFADAPPEVPKNFRQNGWLTKQPARSSCYRSQLWSPEGFTRFQAPSVTQHELQSPPSRPDRPRRIPSPYPYFSKRQAPPHRPTHQ